MKNYKQQIKEYKEEIEEKYVRAEAENKTVKACQNILNMPERRGDLSTGMDILFAEDVFLMLLRRIADNMIR